MSNPAPSEVHAMSIQSKLDGVTLFITPAKEPGMVLLRMVINGDRFSAPMDCRIGSEALLIAAQHAHLIIQEINPA